MNKLAINGGTPAFQKGELNSLLPKWPPYYPETEQKLLEVYRSNHWGGKGPYEMKLMTEFAAFQDAKYAVWMCNGTTTLECALLALGIGPGDEVIVPGMTWVATAEAPIYVGATPVIVDIDPNTLCIDPAKIEEAITPRTKAIIPVHLYSAIADMDRINDIARKHGLFVIEDCAHSHGAKQHGRGTGSIGQIGSFSFQSSKLMTAGEGGCCTTNDERLADRIFRLSHIGNSVLRPKEHLEKGLVCHQYRFTEFQAAIIYDQLQHQAEERRKRGELADYMKSLIRKMPYLRVQSSSCADDLRDYYFIAFMINQEYMKPGTRLREDIYIPLAAEGIDVAGWGRTLCDMEAWNIPADMFVKHDTSVCDRVMYQELICTGHRLLMTNRTVLERWVAGVDKVLKACLK